MTAGDRGGYACLVLAAFACAACDWSPPTPAPGKAYAPEFHATRPVVVARTTSFGKQRQPLPEPCKTGSYTHIYRTDSREYGPDTWLCCVPVMRLLRDSFWCADAGTSMLPGTAGVRSATRYLGTPNDNKVRYCLLRYPVADHEVLVPACLPAPLERR